MAEERYVIIGNGPAGREAGAVLRERRPDSRITILTRETEAYYRPQRLPEYIIGRIAAEDLIAGDYSYYVDRDIKLRQGQAVVGLDLHHKKVVTDHKELIPYDGLIIAVGGQPRIPEPLQKFNDMLLTLKTMADAKRWTARLREVGSVLIVGGDLTSLSLTRALVSLDKKIYFAFSDEAFWPLRLTEKACLDCARILTAKGVEVVPGRLRSLARRGQGGYKALIGETMIETGLVGAFFGLVPDVGFLIDTGLTIERGVLVDEHLRTDYPSVFAAGDCAQVYHPELKDYWVSIGHDNAVAQGRIAAVNLAGGAAAVDVPAESVFSDRGVKANTSWWMEF